MRSAGAFHLVKISNYLRVFGGNRPNCRMTVTKHNVTYLTRSIKELHDVGFKSFSIIPNTDSNEWSPSDLASYEAAMEGVFEYRSACPDIWVNVIDTTVAKLRSKERSSGFCRAGHGIIGITVDGAIYPCHDFSGRFSQSATHRARLLIGSVESGFNSNQQEFRDLAAVGSSGRIAAGNGFDCESCSARVACSRGCPYVNYASTGCAS
jgi:radical SAM protein with 4Fe4S-binding SPASM domain